MQQLRLEKDPRNCLGKGPQAPLHPVSLGPGSFEMLATLQKPDSHFPLPKRDRGFLPIYQKQNKKQTLQMNSHSLPDLTFFSNKLFWNVGCLLATCWQRNANRQTNEQGAGKY